MQFAVILHEYFKCHTCYSTSIKVGWMANTLFSKEMFYSGSPRIIDSELLPIAYACAHREKTHTHTHTVKKKTVCVLHKHNTQLITYVDMQSHMKVMVSLSLSLSLVSTGEAPLLSLYICYCSYYTRAGSCLGLVCPHTRTHTQKNTLLFPTALWAVIGKLTGQHTVAAEKLGR